MATPEYWADAKFDRNSTLFSAYFPTVDSLISPDDPVRLIDEVLDDVDWSSWEKKYGRRKGRPPIQPKRTAAAILYGMYRGIRSSRKLEEACNYRFDFIWLVEGRHIDHSTFNTFRTRFHQPLKDLFKQIGRIAMSIGLIQLGQVAFDGTRVKANNSRYQTRTAKTLEEKLQALDELFDHLMSQLAEADADGMGSSVHLPDELADIEQRRQRVQTALEQACAADEARRRQGVNPEKNPAQVPMTDPDSRVMPNKEGGYAPNYTPTATTDGAYGFIVDVDVLSVVNEGEAARASVARIEEIFGKKPEKFLTDAGNNSGQIMEEMEAQGVEFYAPAESNQPEEGSPVKRDDLQEPVPESEWPKLKRNSQGQLDKACFVYVAAENLYYCPTGHPLPFAKSKPVQRGGKRVRLSVYQCADCEGCPLAAVCLGPKNKHGRTITRDEYEDVRERTAARMSSPSGKEVYNQRPRIAETTFGIIKLIMNFRQFLLRGLDKVKTEWLWAATAFNLMKLVRWIGKLRADSSICVGEV